MDFNSILNILVVLLLAYVAFLKEYFLTYAKKKAENTASVEDAGKLTHIAKSAEMPFIQKQEELKYRLAIALEGEKFRLEKYKALYAKLDSLKTAFSSIEVYANIADDEKAKSNTAIFWRSLFETIAFLKANRIELESHSKEIAEFQGAINSLLSPKRDQIGEEQVATQANAVADAIDKLKSSVFFLVGSARVVA